MEIIRVSCSKRGVHQLNASGKRRGAFSMDVLGVPSGSGSGCVRDMVGRIVTNFYTPYMMPRVQGLAMDD